MREQGVTGFAAVMTTVAMGLGSAVAVGDLRILAANISLVRTGLGFSQLDSPLVQRNEGNAWAKPGK